MNRFQSTFGFAAMIILIVASNSAVADTQQGFEADVAGWTVFGGAFDAVRVPTGTGGVTSASGSWHSTVAAGVATNWGGYNCVPGCGNATCAAMGSPFPAFGYSTSVDIYLDVNSGLANNQRFDFSSAINQALPSGSHRRDFIFNAGFYNDNDGSPGSGTNRFIVSASTNSQPGSAFAKNPGKFPIAITQTDWYTFRHDFYDSGAGVLAVDMTITDSSGVLINSWTQSDPTDIIGTTVGANRYGWFDFNEIPGLPFDNSVLIGCTPSACCLNGPGTQSDCVIDRSDFCEASGGLYVGDGTDCSGPLDCTLLLVTFESISATATRGGVSIEWTTGAEVDTAGYRVLRETPGPREKKLDVIASMIPAAGTNLTGASYQVVDNDKLSARAVYYVEDVDIYGKVTRHGPVGVQRGTRVLAEAEPTGRERPAR